MEDSLAIVAIVERGKADHVVERAKKAGLTVQRFYTDAGRRKRSQSFKHSIESSKEVIIILTEKENCEPIFNEMINAGKTERTGNRYNIYL